MIRNVHQREFRTTEARLGELLDEIAGPNDRLWPKEHWPQVVLDRPLGVGADGGHGPIRYSVAEYEPGRRVVFRFRPPTPLAGTHAFEVLPGGTSDTAVLRHVLTGRPLGTGLLTWALAFRWMHDAVLEELLDRAGNAVGDPPERPVHWSPWVKLCRRLLSPPEHVHG
ncbi:MAG: SRPBCC family protein [Pseudonocardia sp.]|nr:SRPBCC family protein [Pseudonocardia sp.]